MDNANAAISARVGRSPVAPELLEWVFTLAVLAFLVWQSEAFREAGFMRGAGDRFQSAVELKVALPPQAAGTGRSAEPGSLAELTKAHAALAEGLALPLKARLSRLNELDNRAREARTETDVQGAIDGLIGETRLYRDTYGMAATGTAAGARSIPLECAWDFFEEKHRAAGRARDADAQRAYALRGMAALLDGDSNRALSAAFPAPDAKANAWPAAAGSNECAALGQPREVIALAAGIVSKARSSEINAAKSMAMQKLVTNAHWILALWAVAGLLLLQIGRQGLRAARFLPMAALLWAVIGWISAVHVEWLSDRAAQTEWLLKWGIQSPLVFQVAIAMAAVLLLASVMFGRNPEPSSGRDPSSARQASRLPTQRQTPSSRIGYAGFVLFVGLGWLLSLDLSTTGHYANRFQALYQQVYIFAAFVLLTMLSPMRLRLANTLGRWFGLFLLFARPSGSGLRRYLPWVTYAVVVIAVLVAAGAARSQQTQFTSEIFRLWLVLGVSWFFLVRGETALALSGGGVKGLFNGLVFVWPLLFALCIPLLGLVLTDDFGPLFVMLYAASIYLGAVFAFAYFDRAGFKPWLGAAVGVVIAGAWVSFVTFALYSLPAPLARIAERLASVRSPFTATNDQLAVITWFQESAPAEGYGLGAVPWCGELAGATCRGVPKQIQSDYVFTALVGVYGKAAAVGLVALLAFWLVRTVVHHSRATRGVVSLESPAATQQAWLSWIAVCWVGLTLAQLAITVAGNLGWLPLTGISFPFASFGAWSLLANTFFLSLAISLPRSAA
jgi:cell division protein FtsW (lipid II flippase)